VGGDQAYRGQRAVIRHCAPRARDFVNRRYRHRGVVDEGRTGEELHQVESAGQGRASDRDHQAGVRLCHGALPRAPEKPASLAGDGGAGQSVHGAPAPDALRSSVIRSLRATNPSPDAASQSHNRATTRSAAPAADCRHPHPAARYPLIQKFLRARSDRHRAAGGLGGPAERACFH
jgi:hypothetical protein